MAGLERRAFLRRAGALALTAPALSAAGCTPDRRPDTDHSRGRPPQRDVTRPLLRPWADDIVWIAAPAEELPVAYVSTALRQVFVDYDFRDRASWLLSAHISVSTALWRIPRSGDPEGQPVVPGDEAREFEEFPMRAWDPSLMPAMDDIRIVRGAPRERRIDFRCVPLAGGGSAGRWPRVEAWLTGGPFDLRRSDGSTSETVREDFRIVGTGVRHSERECALRGDAVQFVSWAAG